MNYFTLFRLAAMAVILSALFSLRRSHIRVEYSVSWLGFGSFLLVFSLFPDILRRTAASLGLDSSVWFVIVAGSLVSLLLFEVSGVVSRLRDENVILAQRIAILEYHLRQIQSGNGVETK